MMDILEIFAHTKILLFPFSFSLRVPGGHFCSSAGVWCALQTGSGDLAIVFCCLHLEDVRNYAVYRNIANETSKKKFFCYVGAHQPECWQADKNPGQSVRRKVIREGGFTALQTSAQAGSQGPYRLRIEPNNRSIPYSSFSDFSSSSCRIHEKSLKKCKDVP